MFFLFSFSSAFMYQIGSVYLANIVYVLMMIFKIHRFKLENKKSFYVILVFLVWTAISAVAFYLSCGYFSIRNMVQSIFNIQYLLLTVTVDYNHKEFERKYITCSFLSAVFIIAMYFITGSYRNISGLFLSGRMWGEGIIQGWPNSTALPILYALFLAFNSEAFKFKKICIVTLFLSVFLTTSRVCVLGAMAIVVYFLAVRGRKISLKVVISLVIGAIIAIGMLIVLIRHNEALAYRFSVTWDREQIFASVLDYSRKRPISGYGGNSFDVVYNLFGSSIATMNWGHTHNTALELILRYGYVGLLIFVSFIVSLYRKLKKTENKFIFILFWLMSLAQIYFRNFIFISILFFIIQSDCLDQGVDLEIQNEIGNDC